MKKLVVIIVSAVLYFNLTAVDWSCESPDDCSEGMDCKDNSCIVTTSTFSTYAAVTVTAGLKNPNSLGSKRIFVEHPAKDIVLGQLAVNAYNGGDEGKRFLLKELNAVVILSSTLIAPENMRLVYDSNGNGLFDSSEQVVGTNISETAGKVQFELGKKTASYKMNTAENFLIVGDFSMGQAVEKIWEFGMEFRPFQGSEEQIKVTNAGDVAVASLPDKVTLPRFAFEPEKGYFLFASGRYFPAAPSWRDMNKEQNIMHLSVKALDGGNSVKSISVRLNGNIVSYGNGVKKMSLYIDSDGDGDGDELISEQADFQMPVQLVKFDVPAGKADLAQGEEKYLVIKADIELYNGQTTLFYINENDVVLSTYKLFAGLPVSTGEFKYSCDETDSECNPAPSEEEEAVDDEGGCSLLFID
ncbi:MAG TPA: hypothetical protein P5044_04875 [bacterium]|nr:hypothetical protein [bacterium]